MAVIARGEIGLAALFRPFGGSELHSDPIAETLAQTVAPFRFHGGENAGAIMGQSQQRYVKSHRITRDL